MAPGRWNGHAQGSSGLRKLETRTAAPCRAASFVCLISRAEHVRRILTPHPEHIAEHVGDALGTIEAEQHPLDVMTFSPSIGLDKPAF
jgi:hypothetical protein